MVVHCKKEKYDIYIGRPSIWGNPFKISNGIARLDAIDLYRHWLLKKPNLLAKLPELRGKVLGCYCPPLACHGDVLEYFANLNTVNSFRGEFFFLSNFYWSPVKSYPTAEHAYQAGKTKSKSERNYIKRLDSPAKAKQAGRDVTLRKNWDNIKLDVMYRVVKEKFSGKKMACLLLSTCKATLIEGNTYNDTYWGVCNGRGENNLGKILMRVREEIRKKYLQS